MLNPQPNQGSGQGYQQNIGPQGPALQGRTLHDLEQIVLAANADSELILRQAFGITDALIVQGLPAVEAVAKNESALWQSGITQHGGPSARVASALHIIEVLRDNVDQILSFAPQASSSPDAATARDMFGALRSGISRTLFTHQTGNKYLVNFKEWQSTRSFSARSPDGRLIKIGLASEDRLPPEVFGRYAFSGYVVGAMLTAAGFMVSSLMGAAGAFAGSIMGFAVHQVCASGAARGLWQETSGALEAARKGGDDPITVLRFVLEAHHNFVRRSMEKFSPFEHEDKSSSDPGIHSNEEIRIRFLDASDRVYEICQQVLQLPASGGQAAAVLRNDPLQALTPVQRARWNDVMDRLPNIYANYNLPGFQRLDANYARDFVALSQILLRLSNYVRECSTTGNVDLALQKTEIANVIERFDGWGTLGNRLYNKLYIVIANAVYPSVILIYGTGMALLFKIMGLWT